MIDAEAGDDDISVRSSAVTHSDISRLDAMDVPGVDTNSYCAEVVEKGAGDRLVATGEEEDI